MPSSRRLLDEADSSSIPIISRITNDDPAGPVGSTTGGVWPAGIWPTGGGTPKEAVAGIPGEAITPAAAVVAAATVAAVAEVAAAAAVVIVRRWPVRAY